MKNLIINDGHRYGTLDIDPNLVVTAYDNSMETEIMLDVDHVIECERDDPPDPKEAELVEICKKAKLMGIKVLVVV